MSAAENAEIRELVLAVQALNRTWTIDGRPERLVEYFDPEMIAITPTDRERREGREACVAGWTEFVRMARILRWTETNHRVRLLAEGRAAVVAYEYELECEMGGRKVTFTGRDLMTLERRDGRWWLVADHFSSFPG